jgi:hypothetical protein
MDIKSGQHYITSGERDMLVVEEVTETRVHWRFLWGNTFLHQCPIEIFREDIVSKGIILVEEK